MSDYSSLTTVNLVAKPKNVAEVYEDLETLLEEDSGGTQDPLSFTLKLI